MMSDNQFAYFNARSIEERALSEDSLNVAAQTAHLELAQRYEAMATGKGMQAQNENMRPSRPAFKGARQNAVIEREMGEASRSQGFRENGCR